MRKIKVLHIIKSLGRGGAETLLPETLALHNKDHFEFHYMYFLPWKNQMVSAIEKQGGKVICMPAKNNIHILLLCFRIATYIRENNIQLLHCHLPWAGITGRLAAKMAGIPVIYTEHNNFFRYHWLTRRMSSLTMHLNNLVIAVSADAEVAIKKRFGSRIPLRLVLNGVDTLKFTKNPNQDAIRKEFNIPKEHLVLINIAVFRQQKRLDIWLKVVQQLLKKHANLSCILVGDGPLKPELESKAMSLGLKERFYMPGLRTDARNFFNAADIFLMTSDFEGLPIALLEAMSMECAVVATDVGGVAEVVEQGISGLLSKAGDEEQLIADCDKLIADFPYRQEIAYAGRKKIEQHFSMQRMVNELETIYNSMLNGV